MAKPAAGRGRHLARSDMRAALSRQTAHMQHVSSLHGTTVAALDGDHGDGRAVAAQQLDLERGAVAVAVDDGAHIVRDQAVLGEIAIQLTRKSFQPPAASLKPCLGTAFRLSIPHPMVSR